MNRPKKNQKFPSQTQLKPDISYAITLKYQLNQYGTATERTHQQTAYQQQPQLPTSDVLELKVMMKELMEQMGTMLSFLTTFVSKMA